MKPKVIQVFGDKSRKLEPEHHRIEFPGGFISLDRVDDGKYWVHFAITDEFEETHQGSGSAKILETRIDFNFAEYKRRIDNEEPPIPPIPGMEDAKHFAICLEIKQGKTL